MQPSQSSSSNRKWVVIQRNLKEQITKFMFTFLKSSILWQNNRIQPSLLINIKFPFLGSAGLSQTQSSLPSTESHSNIRPSPNAYQSTANNSSDCLGGVEVEVASTSTADSPASVGVTTSNDDQRSNSIEGKNHSVSPSVTTGAIPKSISFDTEDGGSIPPRDS